jgi:hypothetical protein
LSSIWAFLGDLCFTFPTTGNTSLHYVGKLSCFVTTLEKLNFLLSACGKIQADYVPEQGAEADILSKEVENTRLLEQIA